MGNLDLTPFYRNFVGIDRLFHDLDRFTADHSVGYPPVNIVKDTEDQYLIELAVAGFGQDDIDIQVKDGVLTVTAAKKQADDREYVHKGIGTRAFTRTFRLADYMEVQGAAMNNGLLSISLVRQVPEEAKPRRIAIAAS